MRIFIHLYIFNVYIDLGGFVGCNSWCLPNKKETLSQQQRVIFASAAEMFVRAAKKIVVPQKGTENWHDFKAFWTQDTKQQEEKGGKFIQKLLSEDLTRAKRETHFLGGERVWICNGSAEWGRKRCIKKQNKTRILAETGVRAAWKGEGKRRCRWEFLEELGMGRKRQLSPISPAGILVLLLSGAAAWCLLSSASAPASLNELINETLRAAA